ncbi:hypothetical protein ACQY0O_000660 [Thecaphora frezii]
MQSMSAPDLSALSPKPCLTCGRVITPRAKWAKNWDSIKYCSDRCRTTRIGRVVATWRLPRRGEAGATNPAPASALHTGTMARLLVVESTDHGRMARLDIEAWVEATILEVASDSSGTQSRSGKGAGTGKAKSKGKSKDKAGSAPLPTLEDVEKALLDEAAAVAPGPVAGQQQQQPAPASESRNEGPGGDEGSDEGTETEDLPPPPSSGQHPLYVALDSPPGLRERVRRAARRMALGLPSTMPARNADADVDANAEVAPESASQPPSIELVQHGKTLHTLDDFSFAKGSLSIRILRR